MIAARKRRGFTLVELLIALAIGTIAYRVTVDALTGRVRSARE